MPPRRYPVRSMPRSALVLTGLVVLLVLASLLRLRGNDYLLPLLVEPDPHIAIQVSLIEAQVEHPNRNVNYGKYPHLVAWTTVALTDPAAYPASDAPLEQHLERAKDPVHRVRTIVGWLSLLGVLGTWLLARRFCGEAGGLLAAAWVATSLLAVHFGAQARPHGAAIGFTALCLWACALHASRGGLGSLALASLFGALSFGTLQSGLALGFPILAAHMIAARRAGARAWWAAGGRRALRLLLPAAALALSVVVFSPFFLASSDGGDGAQFEVKQGEVEQAGHKLIFSNFNGKGFRILASALWRWEPTLFVALAAASIVFLLTRRPPRGEDSRPWARADGGEVAVLLAHLVPYLAVCGAYERVYERFLLPVLPTLATFAAWGLVRLARGTALRRRVVAGVTALAVVVPATVAWRLTELRVADDTQTLVAGWLEENADPSDRIIVTRDLRLPLLETAVSDREEQGDRPMDPDPHNRVHWTQYQHHVIGLERTPPAWNLVWMPVVGSNGALVKRMNSNPAGYVRQRYGDYMVGMLYTQGRIHPALGKVHAEFRAQGELLARFTPDGEQERSGHPLVYQDETCPGNMSFAWRVLLAERMGPVIEILRLPHKLPPGKR
jgi:hypothetical protein